MHLVRCLCFEDTEHVVPHVDIVIALVHEHEVTPTLSSRAWMKGVLVRFVLGVFDRMVIVVILCMRNRNHKKCCDDRDTTCRMLDTN